MIGMIALAGIIVRNSILLVVFIKQLLDEGMELEKAVVLAGAVRIKPIALTAVSAVVGAYFILSDPIFKDRKSTRLNSSHVRISYAVFCLKKKNLYMNNINYFFVIRTLHYNLSCFNNNYIIRNFFNS